MPYEKQSEKDATQCNDISLRFFVNLVPFKLLFIAGKTLLKLGTQVEIIIIVVEMLNSDRNQKLNTKFLAAFTAGFIMLTELLHSLIIKLFIYEGRYIAFKFLAVQRHSFYILAYKDIILQKSRKIQYVNVYIVYLEPAPASHPNCVILHSF